MILCFELSMPYAASWNGEWSGADQGHYIFKTSQAASMVKLFSSWTVVPGVIAGMMAGVL